MDTKNGITGEPKRRRILLTQGGKNPARESKTRADSDEALISLKPILKRGRFNTLSPT